MLDRQDVSIDRIKTGLFRYLVVLVYSIVSFNNVFIRRQSAQDLLRKRIYN
jgi:hypothetical protein